jgi:hypothetical protein
LLVLSGGGRLLVYLAPSLSRWPVFLYTLARLVLSAKTCLRPGEAAADSGIPVAAVADQIHTKC